MMTTIGSAFSELVARLLDLLVIVALLCLSGCSSTNLAEVVKAMANDPATICAHLSGPAPYVGEGFVYRTNLANADVSCDSSGMHIKSTPPVTNVPVVVEPVPAHPAMGLHEHSLNK